MQRSFKVHFRLVVLGWLRKSEGCSIWLLRLREVLSRESNHLRRPHFFCPCVNERLGFGWRNGVSPSSVAPRQNSLKTFAIGITAKGEVSGLYAVSPTFHIEEEKPTALYNGWLGDWVIKGDNNISNNVVIGRKVANKSINLIGLMGLPFSIEGVYSAERNDIVFSAQVVATDYTLSDGSVVDIHLLGLDQEGKYYGLDNGNYGIAIAGVIENGKRAIARYGLNQPGYPKFNAMFLTAYVGGKYYDLGDNIPAFNGIAELAPVEGDASGATPMRFEFGKKQIFEQSRPLCLGKELEMAHF